MPPDEVSGLTHQKLYEVENHLKERETLRKELTLLFNLCRSSEAGCPIIEALDRF